MLLYSLTIHHQAVFETLGSAVVNSPHFRYHPQIKICILTCFQRLRTFRRRIEAYKKDGRCSQPVFFVGHNSRRVLYHEAHKLSQSWYPRILVPFSSINSRYNRPTRIGQNRSSKQAILVFVPTLARRQKTTTRKIPRFDQGDSRHANSSGRIEKNQRHSSTRIYF